MFKEHSPQHSPRRTSRYKAAIALLRSKDADEKKEGIKILEELASDKMKGPRYNARYIYALGICLFNGRGVEETLINKLKGYYLIKEAASNGYKLAENFMAKQAAGCNFMAKQAAGLEFFVRCLKSGGPKIEALAQVKTDSELTEALAKIMQGPEYEQFMSWRLGFLPTSTSSSAAASSSAVSSSRSSFFSSSSSSYSTSNSSSSNLKTNLSN